MYALHTVRIYPRIRNEYNSLSLISIKTLDAAAFYIAVDTVSATLLLVRNNCSAYGAWFAVK